MSSRVLPKGPTKEQKKLLAQFTKNDKMICGSLYEKGVNVQYSVLYQKLQDCIKNKECNCVYEYKDLDFDDRLIGLRNNKTAAPGPIDQPNNGYAIAAYIKK